MYAGKSGRVRHSSEDLFGIRPRHPYTHRALPLAMPELSRPNPGSGCTTIPGTVPELVVPLPERVSATVTRCPRGAASVCKTEDPEPGALPRFPRPVSLSRRRLPLPRGGRFAVNEPRSERVEAASGDPLLRRARPDEVTSRCEAAVFQGAKQFGDVKAVDRVDLVPGRSAARPSEPGGGVGLRQDDRRARADLAPARADRRPGALYRAEPGGERVDLFSLSSQRAPRPVAPRAPDHLPGPLRFA